MMSVAFGQLKSRTNNVPEFEDGTIFRNFPHKMIEYSGISTVEFPVKIHEGSLSLSHRKSLNHKHSHFEWLNSASLLKKTLIHWKLIPIPLSHPRGDKSRHSESHLTVLRDLEALKNGKTWTQMQAQMKM